MTKQKTGSQIPEATTLAAARTSEQRPRHSQQHRVDRTRRVPPSEFGPTPETKAKAMPNPVPELRKMGLINASQEAAAYEIIRVVESLLSVPGVDYATWTPPALAALPNYLGGLSKEVEDLWREHFVPWTKLFVRAGRIQGRTPIDFTTDCILEGALGAQITALRTLLDAYASIAAGGGRSRKSRRRRRLAKKGD